MATTFTITGELSRQGLLDAKAAIEDLIAPHTVSGPAIDAGELASRKAHALRERAGDVSWHFIHTIANCYQADQEFTFGDLRATFGVSIETVRSWHRNISRSMNRVDEELGAEPRFLGSRWDGSRQHYWMSAVMRKAIIDTA